MKKSLILALSFTAAPVFAGTPVTVAAPPTITPAPACCPISVEVAAGYSFAMDDIYDQLGAYKPGSRTVDLYTADITAVYTINTNHSLNLRLGYGFGDEAYRRFDNTFETDVRTYNIMPGYRYTHAIDEKWSVYAGANIGVNRMVVRTCMEAPGFRTHIDDSDWGLAYSIEIGASYKFAPNWSAFATYGISGSTANTMPRDEFAGPDATDNQYYHGFRVGVSCEF